MNAFNASTLRKRRLLLQAGGAFALAPWVPARGAANDFPEIPALATFLAGRRPRLERMQLALPQLADNGQVVPMKVVVDGPFSPGPRVMAIHLFAEANPVPEMAVFEFPVPVERVEVESRVRLATTQRIVAVAAMSDGALYSAVAEVIVTLTGCLDGT
jgi:sulfur-oxidizing protein SoxY